MADIANIFANAAQGFASRQMQQKRLDMQQQVVNDKQLQDNKIEQQKQELNTILSSNQAQGNKIPPAKLIYQHAIKYGNTKIAQGILDSTISNVAKVHKGNPQAFKDNVKNLWTQEFLPMSFSDQDEDSAIVNVGGKDYNVSLKEALDMEKSKASTDLTRERIKTEKSRQKSLGRTKEYKKPTDKWIKFTDEKTGRAYVKNMTTGQVDYGDPNAHNQDPISPPDMFSTRTPEEVPPTQEETPNADYEEISKKFNMSVSAPNKSLAKTTFSDIMSNVFGGRGKATNQSNPENKEEELRANIRKALKEAKGDKAKAKQLLKDMYK